MEKKHVFMKSLAFFLSLLMIFSVLPMDVLAAEYQSTTNETDSASAEAGNSTLGVQEVPELREESVKHFRLEDGSYTAAMYEVPVHYMDENGEWQDIDNTLASSGNEYSTSDARIKFAKKITGNNTIFTLHQGNRKIDLSLKGAIKKTEGQVINISEGSDENMTELQKMMSLEKISSSIRYNDILENVDLEYILLSGDVKENIIIKKKQDAYSYIFTLSLNNLSASLEDDGSVRVYDPDTEETVYTMPAPVIYDANGEYGFAETAWFTLTQTGNHTYELTVSADSVWMNAEERVYPVTLDPALCVPKDTAITDTYTNTYGPSIQYGSAPTLLAGAYGTSYWKTSTLPTLADSAYIVDAEFSLYSISNMSATVYLGLYQVTKEWTNELTYNDVTADTNGTYATTCTDFAAVKSSGTYTWNVTDIVKQWYSGAVNHGFAIGKISGYDTTLNVTFRSNDANVYDQYKPTLSIHYIDQKGVEDYWTYASQSVGRAGTSSVNLATGQLSFAVSTLTTTDSLMPYTPTLVYNGALAGTGNDIASAAVPYKTSMVGWGFKWSMCESIVAKTYTQADSTTITYYVWSDADGTEHYFYPCYDSTGTSLGYYQDEDGLLLTLVENTETFTITDSSHNVRTFTKVTSNGTFLNVGGILSSITDAVGNTLGFTTDNRGRITTITLTPASGNAMNSLNIEYNSSGVLSYIRNPSSRDGMVFYYSTPDDYDEVYTDDADGYGYLTKIAYVHQRNSTSDSDWSTFISSGSHTNIVVDATATYEYDTNGRLTRARDNLAEYEIRYTYLSSGQVETVMEYAGATSNLLDGQQIGIDYGNGYTEVQVSGTDDVYDTTDDILTRYNFDGRGRCISSYSTDLNKTIVYGATNGQYEDASENDKLENRVKVSAAIGSTSANYLLNGGFEESTYWTLSGTGSLTDGIVYEGNAAAMLSPDYDESSVSQNVYLPVGEYTLSLFYNSFEAAGTILGLEVVSTASSAIGFSEQLPINEYYASGEYGYGSMSFKITSAGVYKVSVIASGEDGTTDVSLDNVMLERNIGNSMYSMVNAGHFENVTSGTASTAVYSVGTFWSMNDGATSALTVATDSAPFNKVLKLTGKLTAANEASQTVFTDADENTMHGKTFRISGFGKATSLMGNDTSEFGLRLTVTYSNGTKETYDIPFVAKANTWQFASGTWCNETALAVTRAEISCIYNHQIGEAYFDDIVVSVENSSALTQIGYYENGQVMYSKTGNNVTWYAYDGNDVIAVVTNDGYTAYTYNTDHTIDTETYYEYTGNLLSMYRSSTVLTLIDSTKTEKYYTQYDYTSKPGLCTKTTTLSGSTKLVSETTYNVTNGCRHYGSVSTSTDSLGRVTRYFYDGTDGKLLAVINPDNTGLVYTYDELDNLDLVVPATYSSGSYTSNNSSASADYEYNANNLLEFIQTESTKYTFAYDDFGNSLSVQAGSNTLATYTYNESNGKMASMTYGNETVVEYVYDELDRVSEVWYTEKNSTKKLAYEYAYDANGNLYQFTDKVNNHVYIYKYDTQGRLLNSCEYALSDYINKFSSSFAYDSESRISIAYYGLDVASYSGVEDVDYSYHYSYNDDSLLNSMTVKVGSASTSVYSVVPQYDNFKRVTSTAYTLNSVTNTVNYAYTANANDDARTSAQVSQMTSTVGSTTTTYKYTYDENGNITEIKNAANESLYRYIYDDLGQLTWEYNTILEKAYNYTYDNAGNILTKNVYSYTNDTVSSSTVDDFTYTYGNANWGDLLTAFDGTAISYDTIGNPLNYYNGYTFTWAKGRQLASATNGTNNLSFTYNADGIRTSKTVNGIKHTYLLSGSTIMAEEWHQDRTQHFLIYLYDNAGSPMGMMYRNLSYARDTYDYFLFEKNLQGDIVAIYSSTGTLLVTYKYDAWGNHTVEYQNGGGDLVAVVSNPFRYRGYYFDSELGLYYLNARYYDSNIGRFINADIYITTELGLLGNNMYAYCLNNPVNLYDETGEIPQAVEDKLIHDLVLLDICLNNSNLTMFDTCIYYNGVNMKGGWGFCDLYDSSTGDVWELKKDVKRGSCKRTRAEKQLTKYTTGKLKSNPDLDLHVAQPVISGNTFYIPHRMYTYKVTYWDEGNGMLRYKYEKQLRKEYQDALDAIVHILGETANLLNKFTSIGIGGASVPIPVP